MFDLYTTCCITYASRYLLLPITSCLLWFYFSSLNKASSIFILFDRLLFLKLVFTFSTSAMLSKKCNNTVSQSNHTPGLEVRINGKGYIITQDLKFNFTAYNIVWNNNKQFTEHSVFSCRIFLSLQRQFRRKYGLCFQWNIITHMGTINWSGTFSCPRFIQNFTKKSAACICSIHVEDKIVKRQAAYSAETLK